MAKMHCDFDSVFFKTPKEKEEHRQSLARMRKRLIELKACSTCIHSKVCKDYEHGNEFVTSKCEISCNNKDMYEMDKLCSMCKHYNNGAGDINCKFCDPPFEDRWESD